MVNKHNLSRTIPPDIKYLIRKEAYFGCVHCGLSICDYEHIDPEFSDAKEHDPLKMTYLCPTCHAKITRGFTSKETVWGWKKNPWCKQTGHCHESFDVSTDHFAIWIGGLKIESFEKIITIDDVCILSIKPPEDKGLPFRLSAIFYDTQNKKILEIADNEWAALSDVFDIVCSGGKIGIRQDGNFVLKLICFPPDQIVIETIDMCYNGFRIKGDQNGVEIIAPKGGGTSLGRGYLVSPVDVHAGSSLFSFLSKSPGASIGGGVSFAPLKEKMPFKSIISHKCRANEKCPCGSTKKYKLCCSPKYDFYL